MPAHKIQKTDFMHYQVESRPYNSASAVLQMELRLLDEHEAKVKILQETLAEGEQSGPAVPFDFDAFIASKTSS